jgi:hypothetical protein
MRAGERICSMITGHKSAWSGLYGLDEGYLHGLCWVMAPGSRTRPSCRSGPEKCGPVNGGQTRPGTAGVMLQMAEAAPRAALPAARTSKPGLLRPRARRVFASAMRHSGNSPDRLMSCQAQSVYGRPRRETSKRIFFRGSSAACSTPTVRCRARRQGVSVRLGAKRRRLLEAVQRDAVASRICSQINAERRACRPRP